MNRTKSVGAALGLIALLALFLLVRSVLENWRQPTRRLWAQVRVGDSAEQVERLLGKPLRRHAPTTTQPDYYLSGYAHKRRPITGEVLIYVSRDLVLYVWMNPAGRVEEVFVGSS